MADGGDPHGLHDAWARMTAEAPDFARRLVALGDGDYGVIDAKGRYWRCKLVVRQFYREGPRRPAANEYRLVPMFGPVEPDGRFSHGAEDELIECMGAAMTRKRSDV